MVTMQPASNLLVSSPCRMPPTSPTSPTTQDETKSTKRTLLLANDYCRQDHAIRKAILRTFEKHLAFSNPEFIRDSLMGCVMKATHKPTQVPVVIKAYWWECLEYNLSLEQVELAENPEREWAIHTRISTQSQSSYLLRTYGLFQEEELTYSVMELGGHEFLDYLTDVGAEASNGHSGDEEVTEYLKQFLTGVYHLHQLNVAHLDLSLENVLLSPDQSKVMIIDFGLAIKCPQGSMIPPNPVGKLQYMAPEVYSRQSYNPFKADVWSCGVMILAALFRSKFLCDLLCDLLWCMQ
jgi:serine/threonine protein kinase